MGIGAGFCCCSTTTTTTPPGCPCPPTLTESSWAGTRAMVVIEGVAVGDGCGDDDCDCIPEDAIACLNPSGYCIWQGSVRPAAHVNPASIDQRLGTTAKLWCFGGPVGAWLQFDQSSNKMLLRLIGLSDIAVYSLAAGSFTCSGTNILTKEASPTYSPCVFPETIKVITSPLEEGDETPFQMQSCYQCYPCSQEETPAAWQFTLSNLTGGQLLPADHPLASAANPFLCDCRFYEGTYCLQLVTPPHDFINRCRWSSLAFSGAGGVSVACFCEYGILGQTVKTVNDALQIACVPITSFTNPFNFLPPKKGLFTYWTQCCAGSPFAAELRIDGGVVFLHISWGGVPAFTSLSASATYAMSALDFNCNGSNTLQLLCSHPNAPVGIICETVMPSSITITPVSGGCTSTTTTTTTTTTCPPKFCNGAEAGTVAIVRVKNITSFLCNDCECYPTIFLLIPLQAQDSIYNGFSGIDWVCQIHNFGVAVYFTARISRIGTSCYVHFSINYQNQNVVVYTRSRTGFACDGNWYTLTKQTDTQQLCILPQTVDLAIVPQPDHARYFPCVEDIWPVHNYTGTILGVSACINAHPTLPGQYSTGTFSTVGYHGDVHLSFLDLPFGIVLLKIFIVEESTAKSTHWLYATDKDTWNCLWNNTLYLVNDACYPNIPNTLGTPFRQNLLISPPASVTINYSTGTCS